MTAPEVPGGAPPSVSPPRLGGWAAVFITPIRVVLLLPGLCSLGFIAALGGRGGDALIVLLWIVTFAIAAAGILLIRYVLRNR